MQTADEASRQVDGRCLVSLAAVMAAVMAASVAVMAASVAVPVRVTGCPQNHFTEPF